MFYIEFISSALVDRPLAESDGHGLIWMPGGIIGCVLGVNNIRNHNSVCSSAVNWCHSHKLKHNKLCAEE